MRPLIIRPCFLAAELGCLVFAWAVFAGEMEKGKRQAGEVADEFVKALDRGDIEKLLEHSADPFNFDGREVAGERRKAEWDAFLKRNVSARRVFHLAELENLDYAEAVKRFGPPPEKFRKLPLKSCVFSVVDLPERTGFMLILCRMEKETWRVAAATD